MSNVGRNDPCWCGSGKKQKKCHPDESQPARGKLFTRPNRNAGPILGPAEREAMRAAGRFNAELLDFLRPHVRAGVTTYELDRLAHDYTVQHGHRPACLGYKGYPKTICTSVNEVVCHGIPDHRVLAAGDIVNVDVTTIVAGWHGDQSETFIIGVAAPEARRVVQCAFDALYLAIDALTPGCSVNEIGRAVERRAGEDAFAVVYEYQGHGIGRHFHQPPNIVHCVDPSQESVRLVPGVCFTVEPMINVGRAKTVLDRDDKWTVRTIDGMLSAQFEHTVLMTEEGPEILTWTAHGPRPGHQF
ncbi:MAG: methionyl aminopeptidase [Planctomycetota bacterium]